MFAFDRIAPILMLLASNVFMTFAWYGHLKYKAAPLYLAILASWGIAFFEYSLKPSYYRNDKAVDQLGAKFRPLAETLRDAIEYFQKQGKL